MCSCLAVKDTHAMPVYSSSLTVSGALSVSAASDHIGHETISSSNSSSLIPGKSTASFSKCSKASETLNLVCHVSHNDLQLLHNNSLRQTIKKFLKQGIPFSWKTVVSRVDSDDLESKEFFIYKRYIYDCDGMKYKIEAQLLQSDLNLKNHHDDDLIYLRPKTFLLYVHHPHFRLIWHNGVSDIILFYFNEDCCHLLTDDAEGFNLELELKTPSSNKMCEELAVQISRMRERFQCGVFQRYFRLISSNISSICNSSVPLKEKIALQQVIVRKNEIIWLISGDGYIKVVILINYSSIFDATLARIWCKELEICAKGKTFPEHANASFTSDPPNDLLSFFRKKKLLRPITNVGYLSISFDAKILNHNMSRLRAHSARRLANIVVSFRPFLDRKIQDMERYLKECERQTCDEINKFYEEFL